MNENITVTVTNLEYSPSVYIPTLSDFIQSFKVSEQNVSKELHNVSFTALPSQLTLIMSSSVIERSSLMELLACRRRFGVCGGEITFSGSKIVSDQYARASFFSNASPHLYTCGLTYAETLEYASRLRNLDSSSKTPYTTQVAFLLSIMNLEDYSDTIISERPSMRGPLGGALRRLMIAVSIAHLAPVMLLEDPISDIDTCEGEIIMGCLRKLAHRGHTVVCTAHKPTTKTINQAHNLVVLASGYTIYAAPVDRIVPYFTSIHYQMKNDRETNCVVDFIYDIASGAERQVNARESTPVEELQVLFESSNYHDKLAPLDGKYVFYILPKRKSGCFTKPDSVFTTRKYLQTLWTVTCRAIYVKICEKEVLIRSLQSSLLLGLILGYFCWGKGQDFDYCMNMMDAAYLQVMTITSHLWVVPSAVFSMQVINIHLICQKILLYRDEHAVNCCPTSIFWLATLLSEIPFSIAFTLIISNLFYFMAKLNTGIYEYLYFVATMSLTSAIGITSAILFASVIQREFIVRDFFMYCTFMMTLMSGYLFKYDLMTESSVYFTKINPLRWTFEALMYWKYKTYPDGLAYLERYSIENFDPYMVYVILGNFLIFSTSCILVSLWWRWPNTLRRKVSPESGRTSSLLSDTRSSSGDEYITRFLSSTTMPPTIFRRVTSVSSSHSYGLLTSVGVANVEEKASLRAGPTVVFQDICCVIKGRKDSGENILHAMSGKCDWGRLTVIMGAEKSGKSSLLHILAGEMVSTSNYSVYGDILYDNKPIDRRISTFKRCGFVESEDIHFRDLTVVEIITYALRLRTVDSTYCYSTIDVNNVVSHVIDLLQLHEFRDVKSKLLSIGCARRLSMAEELVHEPSLFFCDEPISGLSLKASTIIVSSLRELVNQNKTVIVTAHEPPDSFLDVVDTLILLSKGYMIYNGPASEATEFFTQSPELNLSKHGGCYKSRIDFLADISACCVTTTKDTKLDAKSLCTYYHDHHRSTSCGKSGEDMTGKPITGLPLIDIIRSDICAFRLSHQFRRAQILLSRAWFTLFRREKMVVGTCLSIVYLGSVFGYMLGEATNEGIEVASVFGMGNMCTLLSNIQFVYFLFNNNQVFLREHSKGLYSCGLHWVVNDIPLLFLRSIQAIAYAVIIHEILVLRGGGECTG